MTTKEIIVLNQLKKHKEQWITGGALIAEIKEITLNQCDLTPIQLRAVIQMLRLQRNTIIAGTKGYKLTDSIKEINEYCAYRRIEIELELKIISTMEEQAQELTNKVGK